MDFNDAKDNINLLDFITNKSKDKEDTEPTQLLYFFSKSIRLALVNTYKDQESLYYSINCASLIANIYVIIYNYSYNIKLSIFICERSILLFNEYINISKNYNNSEPINMVDLKQFIINKSLGPVVSCKTSSIHKYNPLFKRIEKFMGSVFNYLIKSPLELDLNYYLEYVIRLMSQNIIELYEFSLDQLIYDSFDEVLNSSIELFFDKVNLLKIKFSILKHVSDFNKGENVLNDINTICKNNRDIINRIKNDINEDENINDNKLYHKLLKKILPL